jgi:hypothetical protein
VEWNGAYWRSPFGIAAPPARRGPQLAYDSYRGRAVLHGGGTSVPLSDTWEWDGAAWAQMPTRGTPAQETFGMVYDRSRGVMVLGTGWWTPEPYEYVAVPGAPGSLTEFVSGCASPSGVPHLGAVSGSVPRLGEVLRMQLTNLPQSPFSFAFGVMGFDATSWNGHPCRSCSIRSASRAARRSWRRRSTRAWRTSAAPRRGTCRCRWSCSRRG